MDAISTMDFHDAKSRRKKGKAKRLSKKQVLLPNPKGMTEIAKIGIGAGPNIGAGGGFYSPFPMKK